MTETNTTTPVKFKNPYPEKESDRVQLWIGHNDVNFIRLIRPQMGTFAAIGGFLWQGLCAALRRHNINDFSNLNEFENFVSNLTVIHSSEYEQLRRDAEQWRNLPQPGRPTDGPNANSNEGNVGKRAKRVRAVSTNEQKIGADLPSDNLAHQGEKG